MARTSPAAHSHVLPSCAVELDWRPDAILFAGLVSAIAAVVWSPAARTRRATLWLAAALAALIVFNFSFSGRIADIVWAKGMAGRTSNSPAGTHLARRSRPR